MHQKQPPAKVARASGPVAGRRGPRRERRADEPERAERQTGGEDGESELHRGTSPATSKRRPSPGHSASAGPSRGVKSRHRTPPPRAPRSVRIHGRASPQGNGGAMSAEGPRTTGNPATACAATTRRMRPGLHRRAGLRRLHRGRARPLAAALPPADRARPGTRLRGVRLRPALPRLRGRHPAIRDGQPPAGRGHRLAARGGARARPGPRLLRPPREPSLPGHPLDPRGARVRLHRRARRLPRLLRPRPDALRPRLRRLHGGLRPGRPEGRGPRRAAVARAALLVHGRVRPHPHATGPAQLRRRDPLVARRDRPRGHEPDAPPSGLRPASRHAQPLPHRRLPGDLLRDRQLRAALRRDAPDFAPLYRELATLEELGASAELPGDRLVPIGT